MYHLFDRVYLDHDCFSTVAVNRIAISATTGYPDIISPESPVDTRAKHFWATSVDAMLREFKTELDFFKRCKEINDRLNGQKLVIFCDKPSFMRLFAAWHKCILSAAKPTTVWQILQFYLEKEAALSTITSNSNAVRIDELSPESWHSAAFAEQYSRVLSNTDYIWVNTILNTLSIEHLIANWTTRPTGLASNALKARLLTLFKRAITSELCETKIHLIKNSQNSKLHRILGISQVTSVEELFSLPALKIMNDPAIWKDGSALIASSTTNPVTFDGISGDAAEQLTRVFKLVRNQLQDSPESSVNVWKIEWLINVINQHISDEQLAALMINDGFCAAEVGVPGGDSDKINAIYLDWVLQLHRTGHIQKLAELQLVV